MAGPLKNRMKAEPMNLNDELNNTTSRVKDLVEEMRVVKDWREKLREIDRTLSALAILTKPGEVYTGHGITVEHLEPL